MTNSAGSSRSTVSLPSHAWSASNGSAAIARSRSVRSSRWRSSVTATVAITSTPTIAAAVRCEYSMIAVFSAGGNSSPWQSGQSGQPSPEPVVRTTAPMPISTRVATAVVAASVW